MNINTANHPYLYTIVEPDEDVVELPEDVLDDVVEPEEAGHDADVTPIELLGPKLIFTELMIRPSQPPHSTQELGEYIEIKNIGDSPADPRKIIIDLIETNDRIEVDRVASSQAERIVLQGLRPIEPGGYFVFVREDSDFYQISFHLAQGSYYEYGVWSRQIGLSNQTRTLSLLYEAEEFEFVKQDEVGWRDGSLVDLSGRTPVGLEILRDIALGLRADKEYLDGKDRGEPANWCYHVAAFAPGPLYGSPGAATPGDCL
ncbi:MAG: hypothetical protein H0U74_04925 [Bradymonadaceae bacterium]|nr:hypothetical protein [Lujinxingiaceae bacterium]